MDLTRFCRSLKIRTEDQGLRTFDPNWAQSQIIDVIHQKVAAQKPVRLIVLKARQLGVSTLSEALLFYWTVKNPNTNGVVVAHDTASAEHLFQMTKTYYETWPYRDQVPTKYATRRQMVFRDTRSSLAISTAERPDALRSRTIHAAHFSEVAFYSNPAEIMLSAQSAIPNLPGTLIVLESTANGIGNWFEQAWLQAEAGETDYVPLFFPWWRHPSRIPCFGGTCIDGSCEVCQKAIRGLRAKDEEESDLLKLGCDLVHLAWRRWAIANLADGYLDRFHQEHPSTAEEAFISTGINAFPETWLRRAYEPKPCVRGRLKKGRSPGDVVFEQDQRGPLRIYLYPDKSGTHQYFIGADPMMGAHDGDFSAAHVINRRTKEQVAVWEGKMNPFAFADQLAMLGSFYNNATVACEVEGGGLGTLGRLTEIYPRLWRHRLPDRWPGQQVSHVVLGFSSNFKRKIWAIAKLAEMVERNTVTLHDKRTYEQLRAYSYYGANNYGSDIHDDLVMALAITVLCESTEAPLAPLELASAERDDGLIFGERIDWAEVTG